MSCFCYTINCMFALLSLWYSVACHNNRILSINRNTLFLALRRRFSTEIGRIAADILKEKRPEAKRYVTSRLKEAIDSHVQEIRYNAALLLSKIGEGVSLLFGEQKHFENFDLANIELENVTIRGCFFSSANLARARMDGVTFANCSFRSADLSDAVIRNCTFVDVYADGSRWTGTYVLQSEFENVCLTDTLFNDARVNDCGFDRTDMSGMETKGSEFTNNYISDDV